jgi:rSAM/selenodomain-associated transferase 1
MTDRVWIAAKAPRAGLAKTRLAADVGGPLALALYRAFLADLAARFARARVPLGWYVTPPDAWADLRPIVAPSGPDPHVLAQPAGDWTARQRAFFRGAEARGERRTILIASDSPHLEVGVVQTALAALEGDDVVIGPTHDGGYYLIGMRGWHDVLAGVAMSTASVLDEVLEVARRSGTRVAVLEPTFDVDGRDDLDLLAALDPARGDLAATRRALAGVAA